MKRDILEVHLSYFFSTRKFVIIGIAVTHVLRSEPVGLCRSKAAVSRKNPVTAVRRPSLFLSVGIAVISYPEEISVLGRHAHS